MPTYSTNKESVERQLMSTVELGNLRIALEQLLRATIRTRTIGTKNLRHVLLTMELCRSWEVRSSIEVRIDGHCDAAVDVG
jgi:hypothetical protein